jgi:hypothetical protein
MTKRSVADQTSADEGRFELLQRLAHEEEAEANGEELPPEPTPHARGLNARRLLVTFPDPAWPDAVRALAQQHGCRTSDVVIRALSEYFDRLEHDQAEPPADVPDRRMRAGEADDLPWTPGE